MKGEGIRHWFDQAIGLPPEIRAAYLQSNCLDPDVRSEVLSLLEFDEETLLSSRHSGSAAIVKQAIGAVLVSSSIPQGPAPRVGSFELGRLLGSGGMGLVYEAHRIDGEVRQRVAVKFAQVPPSASRKARESAHRRFSRERQTLASLRHPYIAGLIDAGTSEEGIPYAVIEQVDGVPIDAYCDAVHPDQAGRIRLILKLCEAVQFAHRNLIVHSDIKPDNVLVTPDGIPKLIDFGVANDLSEEDGLTTIRAFTPGYASPEQSLGLSPTVTADVYGLGALLYRLLTGATPLEHKTGSLTSVIRHLSEGEVTPPSSIKPELKGDLENILLKALQREPQRRYGSVPEFADDLNRYLARRPVRASPDSAFYRASRFMRRHWIPLSAAAMLVAGLATATAISIHERERATQRALETRRLAERLIFEVHDEMREAIGGTKTREKLGAIAVQYLEGLQKDYSRDPDLAWELLNAYSRLGQSRGGGAASTGDFQSGVQFARKALEISSALKIENLETPRLDQLFDVYRALLPVFIESHRQAEYKNTVDRMVSLSSRLSPVRQAEALQELARYLDRHVSLKDGMAKYEYALGLMRTMARSEPKPSGIETQLTTTLVNVGRAHALFGDFPRAVSTLQEAIDRAETSFAQDSRNARTARQLYWGHIALADVYGSPRRFNLGRPADAFAHYDEARRIAEELLKADPDNDMAKVDLARAFTRAGDVLAASEPKRSLELLQRAYSIASTASERNDSGLESRFMYLISTIEGLVRLRRFEEAHANIAQAKRLLKFIPADEQKLGERSLLEREELLLHSSGRTREALSRMQRHMQLFPDSNSPVLGENYQKIDLYRRMQSYSAGLDEDACGAASHRLSAIWQDLSASNPRSGFIRDQFARTRARSGKSCAVPVQIAGTPRKID